MAKFVRAAQLIRQFKQSAAPTVAQGLTIDDIWVDTDDHSTYVCTAISPVTFTALGSGGTPGGSNTYVQYNDSSSFGGDSGFTYNKSTHALTATTFVGALTGNATTSTNTTGNAATVTTNANLTGPVTSTGNATAIANGAISNAMLANGAVANLSGTNTGDQTISDATITTTDITTNNATTSKHGFLKKLDNTATHYMGGDGNWTTPAGSYTTPLTTKGDIEVYDSANSRLAVGGNTQSLYADTTQTSGLGWDYHTNPKSKSVEFFNDLTSNSGADGLGTPTLSSSGTGAGVTNTQATQGSNGNRLGVNLIATGTTNAGYVYYVLPTTNSNVGQYWYPSYGQMIYEVNFQLTQTSNGTDRFNITIGFLDAHVPGTVANGIYFYYEDDVNSGKWTLNGMTGSTPTITNSTSVADTNWHRFKIVVNAAATLATFYVDDTSIGTVATLPTVALAPTFMFAKAVGTTSVTASLDWVYARKDFTTAR